MFSWIVLVISGYICSIWGCDKKLLLVLTFASGKISFHVIIMLTSLPMNFNLTLFSDILLRLLIFSGCRVLGGFGELGGVFMVVIENLTCFSELVKSAVSKFLSVISMLREVHSIRSLFDFSSNPREDGLVNFFLPVLSRNSVISLVLFDSLTSASKSLHHVLAHVEQKELEWVLLDYS